VIANFIDFKIFGDKTKGDDLISSLRSFIPTIVILTVNSGIIPSLCNMIGRVEGHHTKSSRAASVMTRNFYFLFMNTIIVPLSLNTTIALFFEKIDYEHIDYDQIVKIIMANFAGLIFI
jgi:Calcium-dependent channel, 7TM region, putative phosphate